MEENMDNQRSPENKRNREDRQNLSHEAPAKSNGPRKARETTPLYTDPWTTPGSAEGDLETIEADIKEKERKGML